MKFVELIDILREHHTLKHFIECHLDDTNFDFVDLYIEDDIDLNSQVVFFDTDNIAGNTSLFVENTFYINFLPLNFILELVVAIQTQKTDASNVEIAEEVVRRRYSITQGLL